MKTELILRELFTNGPATAGELAAVLELDKKFVTRTLCNLARQGNVQWVGKRGSLVYQFVSMTRIGRPGISIQL